MTLLRSWIGAASPGCPQIDRRITRDEYAFIALAHKAGLRQLDGG